MLTLTLTDGEVDKLKLMLGIEEQLTGDAIVDAVAMIIDAARIAIGNDADADARLSRSLRIDAGLEESPLVKHAREQSAAAKAGAAGSLQLGGTARNPVVADAMRRAREASGR